jgi:SnoaL-like domain
VRGGTGHPHLPRSAPDRREGDTVTGGDSTEQTWASEADLVSSAAAGTAGGAAEAQAHTGIVRLQAAYGDVVTRRAWDEMADLFTDDAVVVVDTGRGDPVTAEGGAAMADFIAASIERFEFFEFVPLNTVLDIDGDAGTATGRLYIQELRQEAATGRFTTAYGLYRDRYRRVGGKWRFADRRYRSLARTATEGDRDLEVLPQPED